jgi:hypothetical protein
VSPRQPEAQDVGLFATTTFYHGAFSPPKPKMIFASLSGWTPSLLGTDAVLFQDLLWSCLRDCGVWRSQG